MNEEPARHANKSFQKGRVFLLSLCHFIHDIYSSFLAPLLPFIVEKFSLNLTQAGLLTTVTQIPALLNPLIGKLADRVSVRWFIILAPAMTAIPMSLLAIAPNYVVLLVLLFVAGISVSLFHVPAPVMVYRVSGGKTGRGMSVYMTGGELARTLGPLAIIGSVSLLGFDGYYPVMLVGILASLLMYYKFKDIPITSSSPEKTSIRRTARELKSLLLPLSAIVIVRGFMHASLTAFLPLYIMQETADVWLAGISLSLFEAAGVLGILAVGTLSDRFGRRNMLLFSLVIAPVSLLTFIIGAEWLRFPALVVTGFTLLSTTPVMLAMIQETSADGSSSANGIFMMISFLARSAVVVVVGFTADHIGLEKTYILSAVLGLLGIPVIFMLPRKKTAAV
ncbi:MAG: MFS transporter [Desulfocapsaceae bacterium]|jgi:FSR family fosmidomycin resistance protein-like MFS transporter|nr:MFS transporter [Desulfocapsaceae bacterium]